MNDYEFWNKYLQNLLKEIKKICNKKREIYIDFHIHSNKSSDGKQNLNDILETTNQKGFDIIALTDHDNLDIYDEVYEYVKTGFTRPLIVPGIEFTLDNSEYGSQFHMLQLFINPRDEIIIQNVTNQKNAMFNRSKIQFKRIEKNEALQNIFKRNEIIVSYDEYLIYLKENKMMPEYDSLVSYLMEKLEEKGITTFDILDELWKTNVNDVYRDRRELKEKRYYKLKEKYEFNEYNKNNIKFLRSMLAIREIDDDWWEEPNCGSISVNSYGQLKLEDINKNYKLFFAHPTESKIKIVEKMIDENNNIIAVEKNYRNIYSDYTLFNNLLNKVSEIIGSDSHDNSMKFYDDMDFYKYSSDKLIELLKKI